jgi:hypothetical protein
MSLDHSVQTVNTGHLHQVPQLAVIHEWPRVASLVRDALWEGSYAESDVALACMAGAWKLWMVGDGFNVMAICITEIVNFPRKRKCLLRYLSGTMEAIEPHIPAIEDYARREGCQVLEGYARRGFVRRMPDWTERQVIMQKEL